MKKKNISKNGDYSMAHVLYQKLGNDWYAFTEVDGDCFMTKVDAEQALKATSGDETFFASDEVSARKRSKAA